MADEPRPWQVLIDEVVHKELKHLTPKDQSRIRAAVDALAGGLGTGDIKKLQGRENEWRLRVGNWRVIFRPEFSSKVIFILHVHPRGRAYRE